MTAVIILEHWKKSGILVHISGGKIPCYKVYLFMKRFSLDYFFILLVAMIDISSSLVFFFYFLVVSELKRFDGVSGLVILFLTTV